MYSCMHSIVSCCVEAAEVGGVKCVGDGCLSDHLPTYLPTYLALLDKCCGHYLKRLTSWHILCCC
jgi:hypothetical protein